MVRHAIQEFQEGFSEKPRKVPLPEPPEWGHVEKKRSHIEEMDARQRRFRERQAHRKAMNDTPSN